MIIGVHNQDLVFRNVKSRDSYGGYLLGSRETAIDNNRLFLFLRHFFLEGTSFCAYLATFNNAVGLCIVAF